MWPVGPTPEPLLRTNNRNSESSSEESDSCSDGSSSASSVSSPAKSVNKTILPLQGIDEISRDEQELTKRTLSRLRDLWELTNGCICLLDYYTPPPVENETEDEVKGLGIQIAVPETEEKEDAKEVVKRVMGDNSVKRSNIVKEIIDTEESYIRGLQELVEVFPFHS